MPEITVTYVRRVVDENGNITTEPDFETTMEVEEEYPRTITSDTTLNERDEILFVDASAGNVTIQLPSALGMKGAPRTIKKIDQSTNHVICVAQEGELLEGQPSQWLDTYLEAFTITSDDVNWFIINTN